MTDRAVQILLFGRTERDLQNFLQTVTAHNGRDTQGKTGQTILTVRHHGNRQDCVFVLNDTLPLRYRNRWLLSDG